jgi:hypothetical protein
MKITSLKGGVMKRFNLVVICLVVLGLLASASLIQAVEKGKVAAKSKVDITGKWTMLVKTPQGTGSPVFTLKQAGKNVTGTYSGYFGDAPVTGTVKGNNVEMKYTLGGSTTVYKGKVAGNKMSGTVEGQASGTFEGKK